MNSRFQVLPRRHLVGFRRRPDLGFARGSGLSSVAARVRRCARGAPLQAFTPRAAPRPAGRWWRAPCSTLGSCSVRRLPTAPSASRRRRRQTPSAFFCPLLQSPVANHNIRAPITIVISDVEYRISLLYCPRSGVLFSGPLAPAAVGLACPMPALAAGTSPGPTTTTPAERS